MKYKLLKEFCDINMGQSPDSKTYNEQGYGLPFYQGNADFGKIHPKTRIWCSEPVKKAEAGDILISVRAPIGAMNIANEKCCIGRGVAALTPKEECDKKYLYYALESKVKELMLQGTGSTFKAINKKILEQTHIPKYDIDKQRYVAHILGKVDLLIDKKQQQIEKISELVKSRFIEMFGDPDVNNKGWNIYRMEQLCEVGSSKRIYQNEQSIRGIPFLRVSDLVNRIDTGSKECDLYISRERFEKLKEQGLTPASGDILLTARGTLGRCYIIQDGDEFYFQDGMITWLSKFDTKITPLYITYLFEMSGFRKQIVSLQSGSTVAYLSISMTKKLDVMVPPIELQNQFADFVAQTDKSKLAVQKSLDELETLKKSLMQEYFG